MGVLADKFPKKYVMILIYSLVAASIPLLYFVGSTPNIIYVFAFFFGVALGGDYMIIPLMAAELFGVKMLGRIMGVVITADVLGEAFAPLLVGYIRDQSDNYTLGFTALIILAVIGTIAISLLPKKPAVNP
jgi:MFS family permease